MIEDIKNIYARAPARRNAWRIVNQKIKMPPKYIEIRFCTWIQSAIYLAEEKHREAVHNAMIELISEKPIHDKVFSILQRLNSKSVVQQLDYINEKFECFVVAIRTLERHRTNLTDTVEIIEQLRTKLDSYAIEEEEADASVAESIDTDKTIEQLETQLDSFVIEEEEEADAAAVETTFVAGCDELQNGAIAVKNSVKIVRDYFLGAAKKNTGYIAIKKMVLNNEPTLGISYF